MRASIGERPIMNSSIDSLECLANNSTGEHRLTMNLTLRQTTIHYQNYPTLPAIPETKLYLSSNAMEALFQDKYYYANNQTF